MKYAALVVGIFGIVANALISQQTSRKRLLICKFLSDVCWMCHYMMLGAFSGAAISAIALLRELVFLNKEKKWANSPWWLILFLAINISSGILVWKNGFSLLPMMASAIAIVGFWIGRPKLTRLLSFPISICMLIYDIPSGSVAGIINESLTMLSSACGWFRLDRKKSVSDEHPRSA